MQSKKTVRSPDVSSNTSGLGVVEGFYPIRNIYRWTMLVFALILLGFAGIVFIYGATIFYNQWHLFGPVVASHDLSTPVLVMLGLILPGICTAWVAYANWNRTITAYENGFVYRDWRGHHAWRWEEVTTFYVKIIRNYATGIYVGTSSRYVLHKINGGRIVLDNKYADVQELGSLIRQKVLPFQFRHATKALKANQTITFGPLSLHQANGIRAGKKVFGWDEIQRATIWRGYLCISKKGGGWFSNASTSVAAIPNIDVVQAIIDNMIGNATQK